jgi:beta-N-acetylhexosaminidase
MLGVRLRTVVIAVVALAAMAPQAVGSERMTLEEKVGQLFVPYAYGRSAADPDPAMVAANRALFGLDNFEQVIQKYHVGGFIYYGWSNNLTTPQAIAELSNGIQRASRIPLAISTDQEQGIVTRMPAPATELPGAMAVGATRRDGFARAGGAITAKELRAVGINQNFAPVADVNVNPLNPVIGVRSFSSDPDLASSLTSAWTRGTQSERVAATAKHFPGHGDTIEDSHTTFPEIHHTREQVEAIDLPPFRAAIDAGTESIMTAHIMVKSLDPSGRPATLSKPILTDLLRGELGFEGVIVTDSLEMAGVRQMFGDERVPVEAIKAGADMMLRPPKLDVAYNAVLNAVRSGEISERRIDRSVERILRMKRRLGLFRDPLVDEGKVASIVGKPAHLREAEAITERTTTLVKNDAGTLPLAAGTDAKALVTGSGAATTATLAAQITERGLAGEAYATGSNPTDAAIAEAKLRAGAADLVVVVTSSVRLSAQQRKLVAELRAAGKPVIAVAVNEPYDIAYYPEVETYLATYSSRAVSLRALAKVLFGEVRPRGLLPVDIPAVGDPSTILYPFGHGLEYD